MQYWADRVGDTVGDIKVCVFFLLTLLEYEATIPFATREQSPLGLEIAQPRAGANRKVGFSTTINSALLIFTAVLLLSITGTREHHTDKIPENHLTPLCIVNPKPHLPLLSARAARNMPGQSHGPEALSEQGVALWMALDGLDLFG
jgi:hypothetical protein